MNEYTFLIFKKSRRKNKHSCHRPHAHLINLQPLRFLLLEQKILAEINTMLCTY